MTNYAVLIYEGVEPIDLGATFGVLSMARRIDPAIRAFGVASEPGPVCCASGLTVLADYGYGDCPAFDALVVTGGPGWPRPAADPATIAFLKKLPQDAALASICTGAMILAAAGYLDGRCATTKVEVTGDECPPITILGESYPAIKTVKAVTVLSDGVLTSGGVSLGIDGMLYLLRHINGERVMSETARILEYERALEANARALPPVGLLLP